MSGTETGTAVPASAPGPVQRAPALIAVAVPLAVLALLGLLAGLFWADLDATGRTALAELLRGERLGLLALVLVPALAASSALAFRYARAADRRARRLAEGIHLIAHANSAHRLAATGSAPLDAIVGAVNVLAQERAQLQHDVAATAALARAVAEDERNRLAALISELDQSVLVCNREGRILLYNEAVRALLEQADGGANAHRIGLGRSAFGILDRNLVLHAVETIEAQAARGERHSVQFVAAAGNTRLLRVNVAPVLGAASGAGAASRPVTGFVLLLADVTQDVDSDARSAALLQELVEGGRGAIAGIRAAASQLVDAPEMGPADRARIAATVRDEVERLASRLDRLNADISTRLKQRWPLAQMRGSDFVALACQRIGARVGLAAQPEVADAKLWLRIDSFTLVQALLGLAERLRGEFAVRDVHLRLAAAAPQAHLDLTWKGVPMSSETAYTWQNDAYTLGGEDNPLSLAQVMERHGGEAWYLRDAPSQTNAFRLALPLAPAPAPGRQSPRTAVEAAATRPEFYDFDLFHHGADTDALDQRRLSELAYTVLDTETTGLEPSAGDEIIAIGAVRIVNGRLLKSETFETLVNPGRTIPAASIAIHGITPDLLADQPDIAHVLPRLARFAEDTVLVGHNAAFDMRFLQLKESATGVVFHQPVLDTLLLAAVVHPSETSQSLEAIAARLGVAVIGRHTALGDALATAEVFLGLLPLLAAQGIHTLGQARTAAERTYYARLRY